MFKQETIDKIIRENYKFNFGDYISEGWEIFKKEAGLFIGYTFLFFLALFILYFTVFGLVLMIPLSFGYTIVSKKISDGEKPTFGDFFKGFDHLSVLLKIFFRQFIAILPIFLLFTPIVVGAIMLEETSNEVLGTVLVAIGALLIFPAIIYIYYLTISWFFAQYLAVYYGYTPKEALQKSKELAKPQFWMILLFLIVIGMISQIGIYACGVGILISMPLQFTMKFAAFRDIVLSKENDYTAGDQLADSFIGKEN